ncbi:vacuolar-sorting protein BRO1-like [Mangifera indica]|uniref:vacuolar-sorting protein BRO1-like n=1 Tax=Mangifera indica TaxID=29780 RepID=UPI001CF9A99A|nr:vacuolar-sorting protein BRO1-like [Mangifera indica]XP_044489708.1 vacuolar-sorting protein BRO1-like [Mangifera indica]
MLKQLAPTSSAYWTPRSPCATISINYFKAFCLVETLFPISPDKDHINTITFLWCDAFKTKQKASQQNIHLEKAAVLFKLGQIGLLFDRATVEGRQEASHTFIAVAGAFAYLRDNASTKVSKGSSTTVDVSLKGAGMLEKLMLAQTQESVFENTIAKRSTRGVCAKISRHCSSPTSLAFFLLSAL